MILSGGFTLLMLAIVMATGTACSRWFSPAWLEWMAAKLLARAAAIRMSRRVYEEQFAHYEKQLAGEESVR